MIENLPDIVQVIGALLVILALVFGAVAVAWSAAAKSRTALLEQNNTTLKERVDILERENERKDIQHTAERERERAEHKRELTEVTTRADGLEEKVRVLEKVVTGREQLNTLIELLTAHDQRVDGFMLQQQRQDKDAADRHSILADLLEGGNREAGERHTSLTELLKRNNDILEQMMDGVDG
jgi:hypothetical protein